MTIRRCLNSDKTALCLRRNMYNTGMCGRYVLTETEAIFDRFDVDDREIELKPRYNIAPGQINPVITRNSPNKIVLMKWGLVPVWAKDEGIGYKMINARAETVADKPAFKRLLKSKRCIVPASGFYEWQKSGKDKIPYYIHRKDNKLFGFAGLYDEWQSPNGELLLTYTIITTSPNELMEQIHDRMPVILEKENESEWLHPDSDINYLQTLLDAYEVNEMEAYIVSKDVNTPRNDDPDLIKKVDI